MTTLDRHLSEQRIDPRRISLIKLDLEGAELEALRGATDTLARTDAAVLVEYLPDRMRDLGQDPEQLFELMTSSGFAQPRQVTPEDLLFVKDR
jgi:hypothetical protein